MDMGDAEKCVTATGQGDLGFSDKTIRIGFIRKVYGILMSQIAITVAIVALFTFHHGTISWVTKNSYVWWVAVIILFVTLSALSIFKEVRRKAPQNYICLFIFTLAESFMLGCIASMCKKEEVFIAVLITLIVTLALTLFAFQTKVDFTTMAGTLFVAVIILTLFGIVCIFFRGRLMNLVYSSLGALIFSIYIVYDTQLMLGGDHKYSISPEEYVFAALSLYIDIVNLFIHILSFLRSSSSSS